MRMDLEDPISIVTAVKKRRNDLIRHYRGQNFAVIIFLIRKYIYNAPRIEPWSPEQDGKPGVSESDITELPSASKYLHECKEMLEAAIDQLNQNNTP